MKKKTREILTPEKQATALANGFCLCMIGDRVFGYNAKKIRENNPNLWKVELFSTHHKDWPKGKPTAFKVGEIKVNIRTKEVTIKPSISLDISEEIEKVLKTLN